MNYVIYASEYGELIQYMECPEVLEQSPLTGTELLEVPGRLPESLDRYYVLGGELCLKPEPVIYAAGSDIKNMWLRLEKAPITVSGYTLDCDPLSELRMRDCLASWDSLPEIEGQVTGVGAERKVTWSLADNTKIDLFKPMLESVYSSMIEIRAGRAAVLYAAYQRLKARNDVTYAELNDADTWV